MNTYQAEKAREWIWNHLDRKAFRTISEEKLKAMIADFVQYDLHFMRVSGVLTALDAPGEAVMMKTRRLSLFMTPIFPITRRMKTTICWPLRYWIAIWNCRQTTGSKAA